MELYRRSSVFDRVLAFCTSVLCSDTHRRQIVELVYRSVQLGGGLTLISRMGIESWFAIEQANGKDQETIEEVGTWLNDHVDTAAAQQWRIPTALRVDT
jgi:Nucleolar pre-ribosomal-associated protein 1